MNFLSRIVSASIVCCASLLVACSDSSSSSNESDSQSKNSSLQVGSYVWGSTIYSMGKDGAARLAEAYDKVGFQHVILLVKGESGTIGYFKNSLSHAPKTRTDRDMLAETIEAMHAKGIKVYAWLSVAIDGSYLEEHPEQASYHFRRGYSDEVVDLSQSDYRDYMANVIKEIEQNYDVDGFALDQVRYQGAYFGWSDSEFKKLTASKSKGGYGLTLDEYNELVKIMAQEYGYPTKKNKEGRLVYDSESENSPDVVDFALDTAYNKGVKGVLAFAKMRENIIDDISEFLVKQTNKPVYIASMPECSSYPVFATINYGMTFNKAYTYDVVCPMLYSVDYEEDVSWVSRNIEYLKNLGYPKILPSLQAYKESSTEALAADVNAVVDHDLLGYLLFRTGTYNIARAVRKDKGTVELTYVRGTEDDDCGKVKISVNEASPINVTMGGKLADTKSSVKGGQIAFNADALGKIGDYGTVSFSVDEEKNVSINVTAEGCIVYNAPME